MPVTVLSAARGFPRRLRAHWTVLQAGLAASAPQGRHIVIPGSGHGIHQDRPDAGADAILQIIAEIRAPLCYAARTGWDPRHEDVGARPITWNTSKGGWPGCGGSPTCLAWLRRLAYLLCIPDWRGLQVEVLFAARDNAPAPNPTGPHGVLHTHASCIRSVPTQCTGQLIRCDKSRPASASGRRLGGQQLAGS